MPDYQKDIEKLRRPENIVEAVYASSAYVLRTAFQRDPTIARLVKGGAEVVPLVQGELARDGIELDDITLAALAYIVDQAAPASAPALLKPLLRKAVDHPGPFFVNFATHALRREAKLSLRPAEMVYPKAEMLEVLKK